MNTNHIRKPYLAYAEFATFIIASVCNSLILQANVVFGWGIQGAVYATICSYLLSLVMVVPEVRHLLHAVARHDLLGRERPSWLSHGHQPQPAHRHCFKADLTATRTRQLCDAMTVTKELLKSLFLAAGGRGDISLGGGGFDNELTNWDGTKKRNGWGR